MLRIRDIREPDWRAIAHLASDAVQEGDHSDGIDDRWVENRRSPDRVRNHAVAVSVISDGSVEPDETVVGYCGIERDVGEPRDSYRVFIVNDWSDPSREVAEMLLAHVDTMLREVGARTAWMREVADDHALLRFVTERGFAASAPYGVAGKQLVNLARTCGDLAGGASGQR